MGEAGGHEMPFYRKITDGFKTIIEMPPLAAYQDKMKAVLRIKDTMVRQRCKLMYFCPNIQ